jgi:hypothetical protein
MGSVWDDPEFRNSGNFFKFETTGDKIVGTIEAIRKHTFSDGKAVPQLFIRTDGGEEITVSAGQVLLQRELAEKRPEAGDRIAIELTGVEQRPGGKTLKQFAGQVKRAEPVSSDLL